MAATEMRGMPTDPESGEPANKRHKATKISSNDPGAYHITGKHSEPLLDNDLQQSPPKYAAGYPRVAGFMACGGNLAIFRKFDRMAYNSLLHQQAQILDIEHQIDEMDALDDQLIGLVTQVKKGVEQTPRPGDVRRKTGERPDISFDEYLEHYMSKGTGQKADYIRPERPREDSFSTQPPDDQAWVEVVFVSRVHHSHVLTNTTELSRKQKRASVHSHIVLRGPWDWKALKRTQVSFSIVFATINAQLRLMVIWHSNSTIPKYQDAASWTFNAAGTGDLESGLDLGIGREFGHGFEACVGQYLDSEYKRKQVLQRKFEMHGPEHTELRAMDYHKSTVDGTLRIFLPYPKNGFDQSAHLAAYSITSVSITTEDSRHLKYGFYTQNSQSKTLDEYVLKAQHEICVHHTALHDRSHTKLEAEFKRNKEIENNELQWLLDSLQVLRQKRLDALRDASIMHKSTRREDLVRKDALDRLERKLAAYRGALLQQAQMAVLEGPSTRGLTAIRHWFWRLDPARQKPRSLPLQGLARAIYAQKEDTDDLVTVGPPTRKDYLSHSLEHLVARFFKTKGKQPMQDLGDTYFYSDTRIGGLVSFIGAFLAVGLLIGAIVGLDQLDDKASRLGLICALTVAFALVLLLTTTSTRGEIFGASAAYAAVLVVYVGGNLGS